MKFIKNQSIMIAVFSFILSPLVTLTISPTSHAAGSTASREFIMSCTYGVLAGTLVGVAMLAFTEQPGENLGKVARGASLGLYSGILLGFYVVYGVPDHPNEPDLLNGPGGEVRKVPASTPEPRWKWALSPHLNEGKVDGLSLYAALATF